MLSPLKQKLQFTQADTSSSEATLSERIWSPEDLRHQLEFRHSWNYDWHVLFSRPPTDVLPLSVQRGRHLQGRVLQVGDEDPAEQLGKGVALKSVTAFFTWLRELKDENLWNS